MTHGGKREGAGRPKNPYPTTRITVPLEYADALSLLGSALVHEDPKISQSKPITEFKKFSGYLKSQAEAE